MEHYRPPPASKAAPIAEGNTNTTSAPGSVAPKAAVVPSAVAMTSVAVDNKESSCSGVVLKCPPRTDTQPAAALTQETTSL